MSIADQPFFAGLRQRLSFLSDRQKVLAENVANASTPKYVPKDMDQRSFSDALARVMPNSGSGASGPMAINSVQLAATSKGHIISSGAPKAGGTIKSPDSETTLDGNAVVLEEQMIKVADTRMNYDVAIGLYQKGLQLMRLSARKP